MRHLVIHLVDDESWGGVNRLLDCISGASELTLDHHRIVRVRRGTRQAPKLEANTIVSHMSACWRNLPFFASLRAANPETPLIHVEHSYSERFAALKVEQRDRFDDLLRMTYCLFDKIVAVSPQQAQWMSRKAFCQSNQLVVIPSCVNLVPFREVSPKRSSELFTLGCIGRFHEQKGFDLVVDAFVAAQPNNMKLLLVGDGPDNAKLIKKSKGIQQIEFRRSTDAPALAMAECHAIAMPSRWEPYGLVALEAMAAGCTVFCPRVDGLIHHIGNGAIAIQENTVEYWSKLIGNGWLQSGAQFPQNKGSVANAEWQFVDAWNKLVLELTDAPNHKQMAA